jgi:hypothetical protein
MSHGKRGNESDPNVLLMFAIAAGMWSVVYLLYVGATSVWPSSSPSIATEGRHVPQLASLADRPRASQIKRSVRTKAKTVRERRTRLAFANRVFRASVSPN